MRTRAPLLIGRDHELDAVVSALAEARKGRGRSVFIVGEAGIGKSRLAAEAVGHAFATGMVVLRGRSTTIGPMVPFRPLVEALLSRFRHRGLPPESELGPYRPVLGRLVPEWASSEPTYGGDSVVVLAEAMLRLMAVVGRERGCVLVLDDLQHADVETLAVLEYLADHLAEESSMLLATCRAEQSVALEIARSVVLRQAGDLIELGRLDYAEIRRLVASCLDVEADELPAGVARRLWENSAGIPFVVEELLHSMVNDGHLVRSSDGWRQVDLGPVEIPASLVLAITERADRLGPRGQNVLCAAAVLGTRFPLPVVQRITGLDDHALLGELHAGIAAQLVIADERRPDWYTFQHPLIAEALLARMTPAERAAFSARAADAIAELDPALSGEWCQLAAGLRLAAGDSTTAARLFTEAGRRALANSAAGSAIALLEKAEALLSVHDDQSARVEVLEALLYALAEAGQFERAFHLASTLDTGDSGLDVARRVALRVRLAWVAQIAGRYDDCATQVAEARIALGPNPSEELSAPVDAISAHLALDSPGRDRIREAETLARRAIGPAERVPLPMIACQAWYAIGVISREHDLVESDTALRRTQVLAEEHQLPIWRLYGLGGQATNAWLAEANAEFLVHARREALQVGAVTVALNLESVLALHSVLCGDFSAASKLIDECLTTVRRLQLVSLERYMLMTRAVANAHQGNREEMERALAEFLRRGGATARELPLSIGLARTFCALLEENVELAEHELAGVLASEDENPVTFYLTGRHGLHQLMRVLAHRMDLAELHGSARRSVTEMRWNRHFRELAQAVLLGRAGERDRAEAMMARAQQSGAPYPMARHLGLRLVAEAAIDDGWGSPVTWLRAAEEYFHQAGVAAVAAACRALLRHHGELVPQRRTGTERIPPELRELGVTLREFEVLELLVLRFGNKSIAARLHISPRTVEKHVASLLLKVEQPNRAALIEYATARNAAWEPRASRTARPRSPRRPAADAS
jgi:ATP/maltotriose-dependent transcriptional regulator MalT